MDHVTFEVTLAVLRKAGACYSGYNKVVRTLQGREFTDEDSARKSYVRFRHDGRIPLVSILKSNGLDDALWALRCIPSVDRDARLFAVWCARQVEHLMTDQRSKDALDVAERFANGDAKEEERAATWDCARGAAWATAWDCARDAAWAAAGATTKDAARDAAWDAARDAAWATAWAAARDVAWTAAWTAARVAARDAAWTAAWTAARVAQSDMFVSMCEGRAPWQISPATLQESLVSTN